MNKSIPIITNPEKEIKWMCYDIFITTNNQVVNTHFEPLKERMVGGSYGYTVNKQFHSKKWIRENCAIVLGSVEF